MLYVWSVDLAEMYAQSGDNCDQLMVQEVDEEVAGPVGKF